MRKDLRRLWERFSVGVKLPLFFLLTVFALSLFFSWFAYTSFDEELKNSIDNRLRLCVEAMSVILPADLHDRALAADSISLNEELAIQLNLARVALEGKLSYLYTLAPAEGKIRVTASNRVPYFTPYEEDWPDLSATLADGRTRISDGTDSYGRSRSIVSRRFSPGGRAYCIGADMPIPEIEKMESRWLIHVAAAGLLAFLLAGVSGYLLAVLITRPLRELSDFTEDVGNSGFSGKILDDRFLPVSSRPHDEICLLARNFHNLRGELDSYLKRLAETVAAKERTEGDMRVAGEIQQGLLPVEAPASPRHDIRGEMKPAKSAGGDLFDYFSLDGRRLCSVVGDVSGKGMPAAMFMASTLTLFRAYSDVGMKDDQPGEFICRVMRQVDSELARHNDAFMFVTMLIALLDADTGRVTLVSGGHNPPLRVSPDGSSEFVELPPGGILGAGMEMRLEAATLELSPGEALLLYTDGVTEAQSPAGEFFGEERLRAVLAERAGCDAKTMIRAVLDAVFAFSGGDKLLADDVAAVVLRWLG
ncbi:MAG: serine/threonine-protein phosphatase [Planctomycetota bacterium]|jgi:sigma-B regulation protein RsbU (phosphoserine phosphatase)|nr:serine/threonine-protein phosphatase [Planctomycetota bacterium]